MKPSGVVRDLLPDVKYCTAITPFGSVMMSDDKPLLLDLSGNRVQRLGNAAMMGMNAFADPKFFKDKYKRNWALVGDSLFMVRWTDTSARLVGIPMRRDMFEDEVLESIWMVGRAEAPSPSAWTHWLTDAVLATSLLVLSLAGFAATGPGRRLRVRLRVSRSRGGDLYAERNLRIFLLHLRLSERVLLANLLRASGEGASVGTDELNRWLGMSSKGMELQKMARNRALQQINSTFRLTMQVEEDLVERVRDLRDRRLVSYRVSEGYATALAEALASIGEEA